MPFKSKAQIRKFHVLVAEGKMKQSVMDEWMAATKNPHKLPNRIKPKKKMIKSASSLDHIIEVAGLGTLAVPSVYHLMKRKHMKDSTSSKYELGGLGVLAAPSMAHILKGLMTKRAGAWADTGIHVGAGLGAALGEKALHLAGNSPMPIDAIREFAKKINVSSDNIINVDSKEFMLSDLNPKIRGMPEAKTMKDLYEQVEIPRKGATGLNAKVLRNALHGNKFKNSAGKEFVSHAEDMFAPKTLAALYKMRPSYLGPTTSKVLGAVGLLSSIPVAVGSYSKDKDIKNVALGIGAAGIAAGAAKGAFDAYKINSIAKSVGGKISGSGKAYLGLTPAIMAALAAYTASKIDFKKEDK